MKLIRDFRLESHTSQLPEFLPWLILLESYTALQKYNQYKPGPNVGLNLTALNIQYVTVCESVTG